MRISEVMSGTLSGCPACPAHPAGSHQLPIAGLPAPGQEAIGNCVPPHSKLTEASFTPMRSRMGQAVVEGAEGVLERKQGEYLTYGFPLPGLQCQSRGTLDKSLCLPETLLLLA